MAVERHRERGSDRETKKRYRVFRFRWGKERKPVRLTYRLAYTDLAEEQGNGKPGWACSRAVANIDSGVSCLLFGRGGEMDGRSLETGEVFSS